MLRAELPLPQATTQAPFDMFNNQIKHVRTDEDYQLEIARDGTGLENCADMKVEIGTILWSPKE